MKPSTIKIAIYQILFICTLFAWPILTEFCMAAPEENKPEEQFYFLLNHAIFRGNDSLRYIEFYFSVPLEKLTFVPENQAWKLGFSTTLQATKDDSLYYNRTVKHPYTSATQKAEDESKPILVVETIFLPAGEYTLTAEVTDLYGSQSKKLSFPITVEKIPQGDIYVSDIQLATLIERDSVKTQFYKNGYKVIPNVGNVFGSSLPALFYYSEIYNIDKAGAADTTSYSVTTRIIDSQGKVVKAMPTKLKKKPGNSAVELSRINILSTTSGSYTFELEVKDLKTQKSFTSGKKFYIYRQQDYEKQTAQAEEMRSMDSKPEIYPDSRYAIIEEKELNEEFEGTKYISTKDEQNTFKKLDLAGKRQFIIEFWAKRDPDPATPKNEQREQYLALLKFANEQFTGFQKGWKTDQGRILLVYGQPDEVERSPFSSESKPYHIWKYYSLQGGVIFVFVDKRSFGSFELVHSTARGELSDPEWERWISTTSN